MLPNIFHIFLHESPFHSVHVSPSSRDTTVKVWHVPTATEQKNLGGHTGGVTCLSAPPPEYCRRLGEDTHIHILIQLSNARVLQSGNYRSSSSDQPQREITSVDTLESSLSVWSRQPSITWTLAASPALLLLSLTTWFPDSKHQLVKHIINAHNVLIAGLFVFFSFFLFHFIYYHLFTALSQLDPFVLIIFSFLSSRQLGPCLCPTRKGSF